MSDEFITSAEIAEIAGVTRPVVSSWKKTHADFPLPVTSVPGKDIYDRADAEAWLLTLSERRLEQAIRALEVARANVVRAETTLGQAKQFFHRFRSDQPLPR